MPSPNLRIALITVTVAALPLILGGCLSRGSGSAAVENADHAAEAWTGPNHVIAVADEAEFDGMLAGTTVPVLVMFHALQRCPTCQAIEPSLQRLAFERRNDVTVLSVDVDDLLPLTRREGVGGIPVFNLYLGSDVIQTSQGFHSYEELEAIVDGAL